jgi:hypothetical protein
MGERHTLSRTGFVGLMPHYFGEDNVSALQRFVDDWIFRSYPGALVLLNLLLLDANEITPQINAQRFESSDTYRVLYGPDPTTEAERERLRAERKELKYYLCKRTNDDRDMEHASA